MVPASLRSAARRVATGVRNLDDRLAAHHDRRKERLPHRMLPGLANAVLVAAVVAALREWTRSYYRRVGLSLADVDPSLLYLVGSALLIVGLALVFYLSMVWAVLRFSISPGRMFAYGLVFIVTAVAATKATNGLVGVVVLVALAGISLRRSVRRTFRRPHRSAILFQLFLVSWIVLAVVIFAGLEPSSYRETYDGQPRNFGSIFAPLPDEFVVDVGTSTPRPLVLLDSGTWLTVIDPCVEPPYRKQLVRFDEVDLRLASRERRDGVVFVAADRVSDSHGAARFESSQLEDRDRSIERALPLALHQRGCLPPGRPVVGAPPLTDRKG